MLVQILIGWPTILAFVTLATIAAWRPNHILMVVALIFSLPSSLYLFGGNGWAPVLALYIPLSLIFSAVLLKNGQYLLPRIMLLPIYGVFAYLGYAVLTQ